MKTRVNMQLSLGLSIVHFQPSGQQSDPIMPQAKALLSILSRQQRADGRHGQRQVLGPRMSKEDDWWEIPE